MHYFYSRKQGRKSSPCLAALFRQYQDSIYAKPEFRVFNTKIAALLSLADGLMMHRIGPTEQVCFLLLL